MKWSRYEGSKKPWRNVVGLVGARGHPDTLVGRMMSNCDITIWQQFLMSVCRAMRGTSTGSAKKPVTTLEHLLPFRIGFLLVRFDALWASMSQSTQGDRRITF